MNGYCVFCMGMAVMSINHKVVGRVIRLKFRRFSIALLVAALILSLGAGSADAARNNKNIRRDRFAEVVIDASTGRVLSGKNANKRLYPASLTKMMTLYLTFEAIESGRLSKNRRISVSRRAEAQKPSSLRLKAGRTIRVEDAILSIVTKSANDVAVVLAEAVGGSEKRFALLMTSKARQLGMKNTRFINASGLYHSKQVSTAYDMAILSRSLMRDYPSYYHYFSTASFTYGGRTYRNHNKLMKSYKGMDGLKTGYVYASGYNLASSAVRDGTRLIGVVFGGRTSRSRNMAMKKLLDRGFARTGNVRIASLVVGEKYKLPHRRPSLAVGEKYKLPHRRPSFVFEADDFNVAVARRSQTPQFNAMGLVMDQGDTDDDNEKRSMERAFRPSSLNTASMGAYKQKRTSKMGGWAVQVGAFSSHEASVRALSFAKRNLRGMNVGVDSIAPLMTNRGVIYRARLSGLARNDAKQACRILKDNCLILTLK